VLTGVTVFTLLFTVILAIIIFKRSKGLPGREEPQQTQLQAALLQTGEEIISRLEAKIYHLELLLAEADEKILQLESKLQAVDRLAPATERHPAVQPINFQEDFQPRQLDTDITLLSNQSTPPATQNNLSDIPVAPEVNYKHQQVLAMAEQGYSITEIAKNTGVGKGEIMLLLKLHKK